MVVYGRQRLHGRQLATDDSLVDDPVVLAPLAQGLTLGVSRRSEDLPDLSVLLAHPVVSPMLNVPQKRPFAALQ